jgi:hypothetical protein
MSMGLRDHFATKAMQALLTGHAGPNEEDCKRIAEQAYRMANALVAVRNGSSKYACLSCLDGNRPHRKTEAGIVLAVPCPHCGVDPNAEERP